MMPRWTLLLLALTGCGSSPVAVCAGNHAGTFDGDDLGTLEATLNEKGKAEVTMTGQASGTFNSSGKVDNDGTVEASGLVTIDGTLDLDTCTSSGTWAQGVLGLSGTWSMTLL